ncbi:hypothetical protein [Candidatus Nitrosocosmicus arcticus]|uniref:Uncharacterized protein n=1 Tax=Candidatus Nitrosocosmicus arcticus TaxID=2035267 RepID=A0A557SUE9_9ARCH|nr:hypothetical protein [Candidatus Nitrosocosmicus arcticus]TVP40221.1 hypothetical protein NARC_90127 [Candidatus Nitrosocosmicus arcticus]
MNNIPGNDFDARASDYTVRVDGNHQTPDTFPGSEEVVDVKLGIGSYKVTQTPNNGLIGQYSHITNGEGCSGVIHPDETKTCIIDTVFNVQP